MFMHQVDDGSDPWMEYVFYDWVELEEELVTICIQRLKQRGQLMDVAGWHYQILPFMVAHGYRDGRSWWIKDKKE